MSQFPATLELLHDIICDCQKNYDEYCLCQQNSQPCTGACECCGLSFDWSCSSYTPLTMPAVEIETGSEISEETAHDN